MRVILEVISGPESGRRLPLRAGQKLRVGRTEWADLAVPSDGKMSGEHFLLETIGADCYLEDLGSTNGTQLNGRPVEARSALRHDDRILAGQTEFRVLVEGGAPLEALAEPPSAATAGSLSAPARPTPGSVRYSVQTSNSGLSTMRGKASQIPPAQVAALLGAEYPLYVVVDFHRIEQPLPESLSKPEYLFHWLPEESRMKLSPVLLSPGDEADRLEWIEKGWGQDALVCLFSTREQAELVEHLRRTAGAFARPTVLTPQLQLAAPDAMEHLFLGIDAAMVEGRTAEEWTIIARPEFEEVVGRLGFASNPEV